MERLLKKIIKKRSVSSKDVLTNLTRYLSLKNLVPFGVDDFAKINGNLTFGLATGKEKVDKIRNLKAGALYYKDNQRVLGTKLDFWKSKKTALDSNSTSTLIHIEALPPVSSQELNKIVKETKNLITSFCGGKVKSFVLDKKKNKIKITS